MSLHSEKLPELHLHHLPSTNRSMPKKQSTGNHSCLFTLPCYAYILQSWKRRSCGAFHHSHPTHGHFGVRHNPGTKTQKYLHNRVPWRVAIPKKALKSRFDMFWPTIAISFWRQKPLFRRLPVLMAHPKAWHLLLPEPSQRTPEVRLAVHVGTLSTFLVGRNLLSHRDFEDCFGNKECQKRSFTQVPKSWAPWSNAS